MLVLPVDGGFDEAAHRAVGDGVGDGVDLEAAAPEIGAEELSVVDIAGEAGPGPDDQAVEIAGGGAEEVDHLLEGVAANGG